MAALEHDLRQSVAARAQRAPDRPAVRAGAHADLSYADLADILDRTATVLAGAGIGAGDTVALCMPPGAGTAVLTLAVMAAACAAPLNPALPAPALDAALTRVRPRLLLVSADTGGWVRGVAARHDIPVATAAPDGSGRAGALTLSPPPGPVRPAPPPDHRPDCALLLQTSGSTGTPKLVPLQHSQIRAGADAVIRSLELGPDDTALHTLPMHHVGGIVDLLVAPLVSGGTVAVSTPFAAPAVLRALAASEPTWLQLAPVMLLDLLEESRRAGIPGTGWHLRLIRSVSAPLPAALLLAAEETFGVPVIEIYGMSETAGVITSNPLGDRRIGSVGIPVHAEVRVAGPDGGELARGREGEILVRGASVMTGYAGTGDGDAEQPFCGDWLRTGDLGTQDAEGYLRITGRRKDAINRGGEMISPATVDRALLEHPDVVDAAAFGAPHASLGELVAAAVVVRPGAAARAADLQAWVGERLPQSMVPRPVVFVPEIPRVAGKLRRRELTALLPAAAEPAPGSAPESALAAALAGMWQDALGVTAIGPDDDFFALGGNSLRAAGLVARISERTDDIVYVSAVFDAPTLTQFEEQLRRHYPRAAAALSGAIAETVPHVRVTEPMIERFGALIHRPDPAPTAPTTTGRNPRCAFLLSAPRSGSTLLRSMLAGHPGLFAPPELYLLGYRDLAERTRHFPPPHSSQLEGAVRAIMQAEGLDAGAAARRMADLEAAGATTAEVYALLQHAVAGRLLIDKTPAYALSVDTLRRAEQQFTDPVYIHLVRHPAAMTASFVEANLASLWIPRILGPDRPADLLADYSPSQLGELLWLTLNDNIGEFLAGIPAGRVARVRFEDLLADPRTALEPVCEALGVEFSPRLLDPYDTSPERMTDGLHRQSRMIGDPKFHRHSGIDASRANRWRTDGSKIELSDSTRTAADRYGYREAHPVPAPTAGQRRIWALARLNPGSSVYNVPLGFRLRGELDLIALDAALTALSERHAALRASFPAGDDGSPALVVSDPAPVLAALSDHSWVRTQNNPYTADREILRLAERAVRQPFDLEAGPLWRTEVFAEGEQTHLLIMAFHHIVFDGLSRVVLLRELSELYSAALTGAAPALQPAAPFAAVLAEQDRIDAASSERDQAYWRARFDPAPAPLVLPADRPRPPGPGRALSMRDSLPAQSADLVEAFCRTHSVTPAAVWLAAAAVQLSRTTGQLDQMLCVPTSGRRSVAAQAAIGFFNRAVPVRVDLTGDPTLGDVVGRVTRRIVEAVDHDGMPLQRMSSLPGMATVPLNTALISYQEMPDDPLTMPGLSVEAFPVGKGASDFDIAIHVERSPSQQTVVIDYNAGLFDEDTVIGFGGGVGETIARIIDDPTARLSTLPGPGSDPSDIETVLAAHPKIDDCAVAVRAGRPAAYLVLNEYDVPTLAEITEYAVTSLPAYRVPAAFITVDRLPRTPDGAPDRAALPPPLQAAPPRDVVGPRDDLEQVIADIWRTVLWFDGDIDVHDSFRGLGGHSLLAVQMVAMLEQHRGRPVPAAALPHLDTIAGLAAALRDDTAAAAVTPAPTDSTALPDEILRGLLTYTASWDGTRHAEDAVTVGLNVDGTRPALFWCLQNKVEHSSLAEHLGPDQPVYAMRSGHRVMVKSDENIDLLARHYATEILQIQPAGPYIVGGNCQAARIAIRIATHLRDHGHDVPLLFMMEKFDAITYPGAVAMIFGRDSDRNPFRYFTEPHLGYRKWYRGPLWIREMTGAHGEFFEEPNVDSLAAVIGEHLRGLADPSALPPALSAPGDGPEPLGAGAYRARVRTVDAPATEPGSVSLTVEVHNAGTETWPGGQAGGMAIGCRWTRAGDPQPGAPAAMPALAADVPAGGCLTTAVTLAAPAGDGTWVLEIDIVEQGVTWFGDRGSKPFRAMFAVSGALITALTDEAVGTATTPGGL